MSLTRLFVERPTLVTVFLALVLLAGVIGGLALGLDPGSVAKRSLGTVVIGGLASSLVLTLVLVPIVFIWLAPGPPKRIAALEPGVDDVSSPLIVGSH